MHLPLADLSYKHRTKPVPPKTLSLMADIDAAFEHQIFDLAQRQPIPNVHHHREADYLRRTVEISESILHCGKPRNSPARLKPVWSENASSIYLPLPEPDAGGA
jgi:hypothetical protein